MEKKLKVAIYTGSIQAPVFIENLIRSLAQEGIKVLLFGTKEKGIRNFNHPEIICFPQPNNILLRILFFCLQSLRLLIYSPRVYIKLILYYQNISQTQSINFINWCIKVLPVVNNLPDIFHIQWAKSLNDWIFLKEIFGVKIVMSLRGAHINYSPLSDEELSKKYRELFPKVDRFHAVSKTMATEAKKYGAKDERIDVIYTAVDIKELDNYKKTDWIPNNPFRFISVGRYHWKKSYQYALLAVDKFVKNNIPIEYTIIAKGKPSEEILYIIRDLKIENNVSLLEPSNQTDVYRFMNLSDCLILPSVEEGIANVVIEAMCIGLPVISSNCGGMEEIIDDEDNGLLFYSRDVEHLINKMKNMINYSNQERTTMAINAKKSIIKNHNLQKLATDMAKLYHSTRNS